MISKVELEIVFRIGTITKEQVWDTITYVVGNDALEADGCLSPDGTIFFLPDFCKKMRKGILHFDPNAKGYEFKFCPRPGPSIECDFDLLRIIEDQAANLIPWDVWMDAFIKKTDFLQARVFDREYEYWQNAENPLEYTTKGKSYAHLPMKSNGWPPPVEQMIIDTSNNPGRRIIRTGYVEAIGSVMWIGPEFWNVVGKSKAALQSADGLDVKELDRGVLRIEAAPDYFKDDSTREVQDKLRSLLYPLDEEDS